MLLLSNVLSKKKIHCNIDINFDEICIDEKDGKIKIHADLSADISKDELIKFLQIIIEKN